MTETRSPQLDLSAVIALLADGGPLSTKVKGFERRKEQEGMLADVVAAYNNSSLALIEAGTGTGKSLAYLLPALLWALATKERTLVSTNTITLQEQLLYKDIPLLTEALNLPVKAVLVKGMSNYLCIRKMKDSLKELIHSDRQQQGELESIAAWEYSTEEGSKSELSFAPRGATWEKVCAESDSCTREQCPYYKECYFFKARKQAADAQLLIANHSLLFSDLAYRVENESSLLPDYQRVILDEAHNIEETATEHLAERVSTFHLMRTLGKLMAEQGRKDKAGKLHLLRQLLQEHFSPPLLPEVNSLFQRLDNILPALKEEVGKQLHDTFDQYQQLLEEQSPGRQEGDAGENKLRLLPRHLESPHWKEKILPATQSFIEAVNRLTETLSGLESSLKWLGDERFDEKSQGVRADINALAERLQTMGICMKKFIAPDLPKEKVHWIEAHQTKGGHNLSLVAATLDIAPLLADQLFGRFPTVILCSATLTTNRTFSFIRERLGITPELLGEAKKVHESCYSSPFNFEKQSLLTIPTDLPPPTSQEFNSAAAEKIWQAVSASRGNAFVLFTSYGMMRHCHQLLEKRLEEGRYNTLKQGDSSRHLLLQQFKETDRSVLFGTDSFWEGVDITGEALRCVIIVKLPFKVPTEPIIQARTEAITAKGGSAFMEYSLPQAIMKFKQGFGRLIRNKSDRGCIVCLDTRLINKSYGALFLNSLPPCPKVIGKGDLIEKKMVDFYKSSYRLVAEASEAIT